MEKPWLASGTGCLRAEVIADLATFEALGQTWDAFMQAAGIRNLCITHAWLSAWLSNFPVDELVVVIVKDETDRWVGVAPLKISRGRTGLAHRALRHLQFIGTQPTVYDWMKLAILPDAHEESVIQAMAEAVRTTRWDVLDLQFLWDRSQLETLCQALNESPEEIREGSLIPYVNLPNTEEEYEKQRRKKTRLEVNRHRNRFIKEFGQPPSLDFQSAGPEAEAALDRFVAGHIAYWADRGCKSDFQRFPALPGFYKQMLANAETTPADEPRLLFSILTIPNEQLSYHLGFWQGDSYLSHITTFNQAFKGYSPGTIHMDWLVFDALKRGGKSFEFGRGDEPYKKMWTETKKPLWNLRLFRSLPAKGLWQVDIQLKKLLGKAVEA